MFSNMNVLQESPLTPFQISLNFLFSSLIFLDISDHLSYSK
jgi:hypothetical protein